MRPVTSWCLVVVGIWTLACGGLLPWSVQATAVAEQLCEPPLSYDMAEAIKMATHPLATNGKMQSCEVHTDGDVVVATFNIQWNSLLGGSSFDTGVQWRFDEQGHIGVEETHDTSAQGIVTGGMDVLDQLLRDEVYPRVVQAVEDPDAAVRFEVERGL